MLNIDLIFFGKILKFEIYNLYKEREREIEREREREREREGEREGEREKLG